MDEKGTIEGAPVQGRALPVFDCAFRALNGNRSIPMSHVKMMGAVQPFLSGAISKTVNLPPDATPEIAGVAMEGWKQGLKAIAIYRDGCKRTEPPTPRHARSDTKHPDPRLLRVRRQGGGACAGPYRRSPDERRHPQPPSPAMKATSPSASTKTASPAKSSS